VLQLWDNSTGASIGRLYNTSLAGDAGSWHTYIGTYSGNEAQTGIKIYRDGTRIDDANYSSGSYTAMENLGANIGNYIIGTGGARQDFGNLKASIIAVIAEELSAIDVTEINTEIQKYLDDVFVMEDPIHLFQGKINKVKLAHHGILEFQVERILGGYATQSPNSTYDVNCYYIFKDSRCQYAGAGSSCDKTLSACQGYSNVIRFGGYPSIPKEQVIKG
jgi:hypothetical protein